MEQHDYDREECASITTKCFYAVYRVLGHGFLEKNYENALAFELRARGLHVEQQAPIDVTYKGQIIGQYFADLLVEDCLICELKAANYLSQDHEAQLLNYLKATNIELGLLLNFGKKPEISRKIYDNHSK